MHHYVYLFAGVMDRVEMLPYSQATYLKTLSFFSSISQRP